MLLKIFEARTTNLNDVGKNACMLTVWSGNTEDHWKIYWGFFAERFGGINYRRRSGLQTQSPRTMKFALQTY